MTRRLKQKLYGNILEFLKKQQIKLIAIGAFLALFGICTLSFGLVLSQTPSYQYINKPKSIIEFGGLLVDSKGNIYIGDRFMGLIQVFDEKGEYLYGFYTGIILWAVFDIDSQDKLRIGVGKGNRYRIFLDGELLETKELNYEQEVEFKKKYPSSKSKVYKAGNKIYKYSFLNKVIVTETNNNEKNTIRISLPLWPWPVYVYFIFPFLGIVFLYSGTMGIYKLEEILQQM